MTGVLVGAVVAWGAPKALDATWSYLDPPPPTCEDVDPSLVQLGAGQVTAVASSTLAPEGENTYDVGNLLDGRADTAWVEGADGLGIGETLTFSFSRPVDLRLVCVVDGYAKDSATFQSNSAVSEFAVRTDRGSTVARLDAHPANSHEVQDLNIPTGSTRSLRLTITAADTASASKRFLDTAVSEMTFYVPR